MNISFFLSIIVTIIQVSTSATNRTSKQWTLHPDKHPNNQWTRRPYVWVPRPRQPVSSFANSSIYRPLPMVIESNEDHHSSSNRHHHHHPTSIVKCGSTRCVILEQACHRPWPEGIVPYVFEESHARLQQDSQSYVRLVMREMERLSRGCIKFVPRTSEDKYVVIRRPVEEMFPPGFCAVNYIGLPKFDENIIPSEHVTLLLLDEPRCINEAVIQHELLHILGFDHEQRRSDRDFYIRLNPENIRVLSQFVKKNMTFNEVVPFNYDSVMMYPRNSGLVTGPDSHVSIREGSEVHNDYLRTVTRSDLEMLNIIYQCPLKEVS